MYFIHSVPSSCTTGKQGSLTPSGKVVGEGALLGLGHTTPPLENNAAALHHIVTFKFHPVVLYTHAWSRTLLLEIIIRATYFILHLLVAT